MTTTRLDPPGFLDDLNDVQKQAWSDWVAQQLDEARARDGSGEGLLNDGPRPQFFNPLVSPPDADAIEKDITWTAFPRLLKINAVSDKQRWQHGDASRDVQDEYCEWSIERDSNSGKILRVTFTSEGPEYWDFLAMQDPAKVLALYQKHVSPQVTRSDLFDSRDRYDRRNRWNNSTQNGAMHLIQQNNTLQAEIELAAASTIVRQRNGQLLTSEADLIACGKYGQAERNSDPHIGGVVNALARSKADISLANPIGLCIGELDTLNWRTPDQSPALAYWTITRGTPDKALRAVYEVPRDRGFVVGDIQIDGNPIQFGSQIVDRILVKLTGLATRIGKSSAPPITGCVTPAPAIRAASVGATLVRQAAPSRRG